MPSPPRPLRRSPPRRGALHERSDSEANQTTLPTVRMVGDPQTAVYGSNPYPTKPSQILLPGAQPSRQEFPSENPSSDRLSTTEHQYGLREPSHDMEYQGREFESRQGGDGGQAFGQSSTNDLFPTPSSRESSPGNRPKFDTSTSFLAMERESEETGRPSDDIVHLPSVPYNDESEEEETYPSSNASEPPVNRPFTKDSDASRSSANSTGTMIVRKNRDGRRRPSYSAFPPSTRPRSSSSRSSQSSPTNYRPAQQDEEPTTRESPVSPISPEESTFASASGRRTPSVPGRTAIGAGSRNSINFQYPIIKPPSSSRSWAESSSTAPRIPPKAPERNLDRWNPHLSTVPSEGTGSNSAGERNSQNTWRVDSSRGSKSSSGMFSPPLSSDLSQIPSPLNRRSRPDLSLLPPPPSDLSYPPPVLQREAAGTTIRVVNEQAEPVAALPRRIPAERGSRYLEPKSQDNLKNGTTRPSSRASFLRDGIPAWARAYYARPTSSLSIPGSIRDSRRLSTSTDNISLNIFRARNAAIAENERRKSELANFRGSLRRKLSPPWSPHLWHDRTSLGRQRSMFKVPSMDERAEGNSLTKRNAQIAFFALGFIIPIAWFIASFLPLPLKPVPQNTKGKNVARRPQTELDMESQIAPIDHARYENARWWRQINRIMCVFGVLIIAAIIVLAVVSVR